MFGSSSISISRIDRPLPIRYRGLLSARSVNPNVVANYSARLWSAIAVFAFVPAYVRLLGPDAYGLIAFSTSVLGLLFILDLGMSNVLAREMARETDDRRLANLLRTFETMYLAIVVVASAAVFLSRGVIAHQWLEASTLPSGTVERSVALMGCSAVIQVMLSLYIGAFLGSNRHVTAAIYQISFGIVRSGLVIIPLLLSRSVEVFFWWQLAASILFLVAIRQHAWKLVGGRQGARFSRASIVQSSGFAAGMFGISLIAAINTQSDKLVVSSIFPLEQLAFYQICSLLGQTPSMLALPLAVTVLPQLTRLLAQERMSELRAVYLRYSYLVSACAFLVAGAVVVGAHRIVALMAGVELAAVGDPSIAALLAVAGACLAIQYMPYHLAVAAGHTRTNLILGAISAVCLPVAMAIGAQRFGFAGAALPWLIMNLIAGLVLALVITPRFVEDVLGVWFRRTVALPLAIVAGVMTPTAFLAGASRPYDLVVIAGGLALSLVLCAVGFLWIEKRPDGWAN